MSKEIDTLTKAREQLVLQRRTIADALAGGYNRGATENQIELLVKYQNAIDAIDRALEDEQLAEPDDPDQASSSRTTSRGSSSGGSPWTA
jgi:hypothetical protein